MPRMTTCASCEKPIQIGPGSRPPGESKCQACWRAEIVHGSVKRGYRKGCRCGECRAANSETARRTRARRKERTGLAQKRRGSREYLPASVIRPCSVCGKQTYARGPEPMCKPCAMQSRNQTVITTERRQAIYDRDGWVCGFCGYDVDPTVSGSEQDGPTLDHVIPRSKGGSDDESNLRLVHRYCNTVRSNRDALTIDQLAS